MVHNGKCDMTEDTTSKIEKFFTQYRLRHYTKGQILILNGDDTGYIYFLVKGRVKKYDVSHRGDEIIVNVFKPPAFFPMSLAINKKQNPYIYEAETDIEIHQVPAGEVVTFVKDNSDVMYDLLSRVYSGIDGILGRMVHLMTGNARSRLIYELIIDADRFGTMQKDGSCLLAIHEKDLGIRAAISRETVSREMNKLKAEAIIEISNKGILIRNLEAFKSKLDQAF